MKKFRYSLKAASVAAVISVVMPAAALLSGCSQSETSAEEKVPAGKRGVLVNVDKKGVILKGYDVVAYFTQGRAVKGNPNYSSRLWRRHLLFCFRRR
jgi:major membrane immunogen (membrane-anchored lipoprotein)